MSSQPINYPATPSLVMPPSRVFSWSGIFAGTFLFLAIEATFGTLAAAIFGTPYATGHVGIGDGIWMIVLSIIALYFAGRLASKLSGANTRNLGMYAGLITFGMSLVATVLVMAQAGPVHMVHILSVGGYWLFIGLILSMISAAWGGTHGIAMSGRAASADRSSETRQAA